MNKSLLSFCPQLSAVSPAASARTVGVIVIVTFSTITTTVTSTPTSNDMCLL